MRRSVKFFTYISSENTLISYSISIVIIIDLITEIINVLTFLMCINYRSKARNVYWNYKSKNFQLTVVFK